MAFVSLPFASVNRASTCSSPALCTAPTSSFTAARSPASRLRTAPVRHVSQPRMAAMERTYIMAKPDAVQRGLIGKIITKFEDKGFKLVAMRMRVPDRATVEEHYSALSSKPFFGDLVDFLVSGPVVSMVWEGKGVIGAGRMLLGATNPLASDPSTIRGAYGVDVGRNVCHGSDEEPGSADREIKLWFDEEELCDWTPAQTPWVYE